MNRANPYGAILSVALLLRHSLQRPDLAAAVEAAVDACIDDGVLTADIGGSASTSDVGAAVVAALPAQRGAAAGVRVVTLEIYDTTLRDGAQGVGINFSVSDKVRIAEHLDRIGVTVIEGGWPGANQTDTEFFAEMRGATFGARAAGGVRGHAAAGRAAPGRPPGARAARLRRADRHAGGQELGRAGARRAAHLARREPRA